MSTHVFRSVLSPLSFLDRASRLFKNKIAIVNGADSLTYGDLGDQVQRFASALLQSGLRPGDRVAFLCPNTPEMLAAHFAIPLAGGVLVAINTRLSAGEIQYILDHSGSRFLFVDAELNPLVKPSLGQLKTVESIIDLPAPGFPDRIGQQDFATFLGKGRGEPLALTAPDEDTTIAINYTSGTTGKPKGVMYTHRSTYLNALGNIIEARLGLESVYLWTLPMFHCNGWCFPWAVTAVGATHVCLRKFDPSAAWAAIKKHQVSHYCGAPVVHVSMLNHPDRPQKLDRSLIVPVGGAPPSPTLMELMESIGGKFLHIYGLTETYGPYTANFGQLEWEQLPVTERARLMARQGFNNIMASRVRVVDESMQDVPADGKTMGEVVMQGNIVMKGYYNDPEATAKAFRGDWFHSGDLAVVHPDGYVELRDRGKDIIISGGENISSIEVEQVILRHPAVLEVAIIGIPHEKWGETPKAFVTLKTGQNARPEEIIQFCRDHLAHFKCPTQVEFTALPKTSTGKIQKYVLREKEWAGRTSRIQGA